jgi:hypothetical protein
VLDGLITPGTFVFALAVGFAVGIAGLSLRYGVQTMIDEAVGMARGVAGWAGFRVQQERTTTTPWFCTACHSQNVATARRCYRGCGPRNALEDREPVEAAQPTSPRNGTASRGT